MLKSEAIEALEALGVRSAAIKADIDALELRIIGPAEIDVLALRVAEFEGNVGDRVRLQPKLETRPCLRTRARMTRFAEEAHVVSAARNSAMRSTWKSIGLRRGSRSPGSKLCAPSEPGQSQPLLNGHAGATTASPHTSGSQRAFPPRREETPSLGDPE
jgi:hypothetical protein